MSHLTSTSTTQGRSLWFGLLAGPIAGALHLLVNFYLIPALCPAGVPRALLSVVAFGLTLAAALATLYGGWVSYCNREQVQVEEGDRAARRSTKGRWQFIAVGGIMLSVLALFLIIITGLPALSLNACA